MRAPFQILAIPYKYADGKLVFGVLHRSDYDQWQFIAGGGEDSETPEDAAKREIREEGGISVNSIISLTSMCHVPVEIFPRRHLYNWPETLYVVPEFSFGFACNRELILSREHTEYTWLSYEEAKEKLQWDSNKTALFELNCILTRASNASFDASKP